MKFLNKLPFIIALFLLLYSCGLFNGEQETGNGEQVNTEQVSKEINYPEYSVIPETVYDGDTLRVKASPDNIKIRFACVDTPEIKQSLGIPTRDYLRSLLKKHGNKVRVQEITTDRYGRTVAVLYLPNGEAVQEIQAREGMAFPYPRYKSDCPIWDEVESAGNEAKSKKLGVWKTNNPEYPWEWRKLNK